MNDRQKIKIKIQEMKYRLKKGENPIEVMGNAFEGCTVLVVSAGPSAKKWKEVYALENNKDIVIVTIKRMVNDEELKKICDINFFNAYNIVKLTKTKEILSIAVKNSSGYPVFGKRDIEFCTEDQVDMSTSETRYLSIRGDFEAYSLSNTGLTRPVGPGIMFDAVFFTLVHLGFKEIITVGWDIADETGVNSHAYSERAQKIDGSYYERRKKRDNLKVKFKVFNYSGFKTLVAFFKFIKAYSFYHCGFTANKMVMFPGEAEITSQGIAPLKKWLELKKVKYKFHSDSECIKKVL